MTKKRNPNDATFRNITALKKRVKALVILTKYQGRLLRSHGIRLNYIDAKLEID